jgi:TonB family protein
MVDLIPSHKKGIHVMKKNPCPLTFYVVVVAASILLLAPCAPAQEKKKENQKSAPANSAATPSPTPVNYDRVFSSKEVTQKARITARPEPQFTEAARYNNIEGTVVVRAVLSSTGQVTNIRVVSGLPYGLSDKAIMAAQQLKFIPAMKDGQAVSQYVQIEYNFNLFFEETDPYVKTKPVILEKPEPEYTDAARQHKVHGTVVLEVVLTPSRGAWVSRVIKGLPDGLTEQAADAVQKIKFEPAVSARGVPISIVKVIEYKFKL